MKQLAVAIAIILAPQSAQPPIDDPEARIVPDLSTDSATVMSPLEVRAGGPAWWEVSRGNRTVYVLGVLWHAPADLTWSRIRLENRLREVRLLLTPPTYEEEPAPADARVAVTEPIPAALQPRVAAAARRIGQAPGRYARLSPVLAGYLLAADFRKSLKLEPGVLVRHVNQTRTPTRLERRSMASFKVRSVSLTAASASSAAGLACLEAALAEIEAGPEPMLNAIEGWRLGDVNAALAEPRAFDLCTFAIPAEAELRRKSTKAQAEMIADILSGRTVMPNRDPAAKLRDGGASKIRVVQNKTVAVVGLRSLVAEGGVLDQLRSKGYAVKAPAGLR